MLSLKKLIQLPTRKAMGPNCHGLWIYYIFLLTIWLPSVLLPLRQNVIFNQFQQIPYALRLENKWYFNITHYRGASSSPDLLSCSVCGVLVFVWFAFFQIVCSPAAWYCTCGHLLSCLGWEMQRDWGVLARTCETTSQPSILEHCPQPGLTASVLLR